MIGHLFANYIVHKYITPPYLSLIVSGGHTELVHVLSEVEYVSVGKTYDDAAGETFDKIAKLLDLGYPGGPAIDKLAINGDSEFYRFPRALADKGNYDFSFSGLKTSVKQFLCTQSSEFINSNKINLAASIQEAIIDPLVNKTIRYAKKNGIKQILLCGGVAANSRLRSKMMEIADRLEIEILYPPINLCIDNAAMIAAAAIAKLQNEQYSDLTINAFSKKGIRHI
jgi:N6-L-threonylcarbamoyladenine synthase